MRGTDEAACSLSSYVDLEERIPGRHPLRKIRQVVNDALASLDVDFDRFYSAEGRPSIAPERLVIPPFSTGCIRRIHAAIFSFCAGVMRPMPRCPAMVCLQTMIGMFGRSLL